MKFGKCPLTGKNALLTSDGRSLCNVREMHEYVMNTYFGRAFIGRVPTEWLDEHIDLDDSYGMGERGGYDVYRIYKRMTAGDRANNRTVLASVGAVVFGLAALLVGIISGSKVPFVIIYSAAIALVFYGIIKFTD